MNPKRIENYKLRVQKSVTSGERRICMVINSPLARDEGIGVNLDAGVLLGESKLS